jgi:hypothetical protein
MTQTKKKLLGLLAGLSIAMLLQSKAFASTNTVHVDIHVSINATKSLAVNTSYYDYGALSVNISSVSSNLVVTNDSGGFMESYALQGANAVSDAGGTNWTLNQTQITTDTYRLGAQFSNAQPSNLDASWNSDYLTTTLANITTDQIFGNNTPSESGYQVRAVTQNTRNLWFRMHTPDVVTDAGAHTATVTIAVQ